MGKKEAQILKQKVRTPITKTSFTKTNVIKTPQKVPLEVRRGVDCSLCGRDGSDNGECFGQLFYFELREKRYAVHELCLMLAANLVVPKDHVDSSVLMGFRPKDILKEVRRGSSLACSVCRHRGATLGCQNCRLKFHMPCAREADAFFDFSDCWTYCKSHWPALDLGPMSSKKPVKTDMTLKGCLAMVSSINFPTITQAECSLLCTEPIEPRPQLLKVVMTNCCQPLLTHFDCMQKYVAMMGSDTKCARCNVSDEAFHKMLNKQGIYVSVREATLDDLVDHTWRCIATDCKCPMGRAYFDKPNPRIFQSWEWINDCPTCESEIHRACAGPPWSLFDPNEDAEGEESVWVCQGCSVNTVDAPGSVFGSPASSRCSSRFTIVELDAADSGNDTNKPLLQLPNSFGSPRRSIATNTADKHSLRPTAVSIPTKKTLSLTKIIDLCRSSSEDITQPISSKTAVKAELMNQLDELSNYRKRSANENHSPVSKRRKTNPSAKSPSQRVNGPLDRFVVKVPFGSDALATSSPRIRH